MKVVENTTELLIVEKAFFLERVAGPSWIAVGIFCLWGVTADLALYGGELQPAHILFYSLPIALFWIGVSLLRNSGPVRLTLDRPSGSATITQTRLSGTHQHDLPLDQIDALHVRFTGFSQVVHWEFLLRDGTKLWIGKTMQKRWSPMLHQSNDPEIWDVFKAATALKRWLADASTARVDADPRGARQIEGD